MTLRPAMTRQQGFDLQQWIEDKRINYTPCVCGSTEIVVSEKFYGPVAITADGDAPAGESFEAMPLAAIACTACARVQFLDLRVVGIV
jgi:hypothetical protein